MTALWVVTIIVSIAYAIVWHASMHFIEGTCSASAAATAAQWLVRGGVVPLGFVATGLLASQLGAKRRAYARARTRGAMMVAW